MKHKQNHNHQEFATAVDASITNEVFEDLDQLTINQEFLEQDLLELADSPMIPNVPLQKAMYITEIEQEFYFLDCTKNINQAEPTLITANSSALAKSQALAQLELQSPTTLLKSGNSILKSPWLLGKRGLLIGMTLGACLTLGVSRLLLTPSSSETSVKDSEIVNVPKASAPTQTVTVTEVKTTKIDNLLDVSGTVIAYERTPVMSQAAGLQIIEVFAERGDFVNRGQVLAKLNNKAISAQRIEAAGSLAQAQARLDELLAGTRTEEIAQAEARIENAKSAIAQAESNLALVQKRVERNRNLEKEGAITRDSFDEVLSQEQVQTANLAGAKASLAEAEQALKQSKAGSRPQTIAQSRAELTQAQGRLAVIDAQLNDTTIVAPTSGVIAVRDARVGQISSTSEMLFSIIKNGRLELRLQIPETLINRVQLDQKVQISSNSNQDLKLAGKVREIDPVVDDSSRQATVKVDLPNSRLLKPGMFLQAAINTNSSLGQVVPVEALLPQSGNNAIAFVVQSDNTVKAQTVKMGEILSGQTVEVIDGLNSGDRIVLKGAAYLKDGDLIKISQ